MPNMYSETRRSITDTLWVDETLTVEEWDADFGYLRVTVPSDLHAYKKMRRANLTPTEARSRISVSHGGPTIPV